ncbi:MAG: phosphoribosylformylglycinamidine synthase [Christensenellaceae bacterium]|nr:phosphoribosylformylglycinamidine synthase [Christensenellaceae bacterium]
MVYRILVEKKPEFAVEAASVLNDLRSFLGISSLEGLRLINCYDVEDIDTELLSYVKNTVFSEPQTDNILSDIPSDADTVFAVEYLPGQFDQRADSAAQCISLVSQGERPTVHSSKIYVLKGNVSKEDLNAIKHYVINPVESREASLAKPETLKMDYAVPTEVETLNGFTSLDEDGLKDFLKQYGLAMDIDDLKFLKSYFVSEHRDPTITEIRMIDTYWSDHCRHTTFLTTIDSVKFEDEFLQEAYNKYIKTREFLGRTKPVNLMDIGTLAAKYLKKTGKLNKLDESEEINACTVKMNIEVNGVEEPWLLLFKNETHNHPTEIEPFGGAATCIGGAIRDPLSGRSYVYGAMRVTGAADPLKPIGETLKGKLPQKKLVATAAQGYSSYGNQIGLATGQVDEIYHPGYAAKRMEIGAVIAAAPEKNVRRERPIPGDVVILLGGKTGRDGCGGATGSSKSHTLESLETCGAEVQKGNAPEERKLQRLFRNEEASRLIKRCNDFGAGGVSVAIGELADGLKIDLNAVPKKYEGLDGTELAISESQERMAVVVAKEDAPRFMLLAEEENLEATLVAVVTEEPRLTMSWNGKNIVDISREFLDSNGAEKHIDIIACEPKELETKVPADFVSGIKAVASDLNTCSKRGLSERFDSTIGAGTVMMPFGGKFQHTPSQAMVNKISVEKGDTTMSSLMAWGYDPFVSEKSPAHGAYRAVVESVTKLVASGAAFEDVYLTFQEYFEKPGKDPSRWGKPLSALLGAFKAQMDLEVAAIGGKDSRSGSFEDMDVPPTLVSFAVTTELIKNIITPEFKGAGHDVVILRPDYDKNGLPVNMKALYNKVTAYMREGKVLAAYTPTMGGVAEAIYKMCFGNMIGFKFADVELKTVFERVCGAFILELASPINEGEKLGTTTDENAIVYKNESVNLKELFNIYEGKLEPVYAAYTDKKAEKLSNFNYTGGIKCASGLKIAKPTVLIPVFPGTNCEYDSAKAVERAGAKAEIVVIKNLTAAKVAESVNVFAEKLKNAQMVFIPGGFSGGDEPDGSAKFITAFMRNAVIKDGIHELLKQRDGLICGICNGFQALIKLGLVPFGEIIDTDETCPTLTFNTIGRHQSRIVRTRVASNLSPWLKNARVGEVYNVAISHGEGRFIASEELVKKLAANGQIATQYVDMDGDATTDILYNPNGSVCAIEGITSPDGRVFGKMGHSERIGEGLYKNVPGNYDIGMFKSAVEYFD